MHTFVWFEYVQHYEALDFHRKTIWNLISNSIVYCMPSWDDGPDCETICPKLETLKCGFLIFVEQSHEINEENFKKSRGKSWESSGEIQGLEKCKLGEPKEKTLGKGLMPFEDNEIFVTCEQLGESWETKRKDP